MLSRVCIGEGCSLWNYVSLENGSLLSMPPFSLSMVAEGALLAGPHRIEVFWYQ